MKMKQISVFEENEPGRLQALLRVLKSKQINIRALSVVEQADFGIVRIIVAEPEDAPKALREAGLTVKLTNVLAMEIPDQPRGLLDCVAEPLAKNGINLEYFYAFIEPTSGKLWLWLKPAIRLRSGAGSKIIVRCGGVLRHAARLMAELKFLSVSIYRMSWGQPTLCPSLTSHIQR
jgi:hypothetical protein